MANCDKVMRGLHFTQNHLFVHLKILLIRTDKITFTANYGPFKRFSPVHIYNGNLKEIKQIKSMQNIMTQVFIGTHKYHINSCRMEIRKTCKQMVV